VTTRLPRVARDEVLIYRDWHIPAGVRGPILSGAL